MVTKRKTERVKEAIEELKGLILANYPAASFEIVRGWDPPGVYLEVTVETNDFNQAFHGIMDTVMDRYLEIFNEEGLDIYVMPIRPREPVG